MRHPIDYHNFDTDVHFGYNFLSWANESNAFHPGVDYNLGGTCNEDMGSPVYPVKKGTVIKVNLSESGYGNMIVVDHGDFYSKYAHLQDINIKDGDKVHPMESMATMGHTGTYCSHLHLEIFPQETMDIMKKERGDNWFQFYPVDRSKDWVKKHYHNPLNFIQPQDISVKLVCNGTKRDFFLDLDERLENLKTWFKDKTADQINLTIDTEYIEYEDVDYGTKYIDQKWLRRNVLPYCSGYDIGAFIEGEEDFAAKNIWGVAFGGSDLGVETIHQLGSNLDRSNNRGWSDSQFLGTLRHEILHTLFDMCGNDAEQDEILKESSYESIVHHYDYGVGDIAQSLKHIDFDQIEGWDISPFYRVFTYENNVSHSKEKITWEPEVGRYYKAQDLYSFFKYTESGWKEITQDEFNDAMVDKGGAHTSMARKEANWILDQIGNDLPYGTRSNIEMMRYSSKFRRKFYEWVPSYWVNEIPKKHLND